MTRTIAGFFFPIALTLVLFMATACGGNITGFEAKPSSLSSGGGTALTATFSRGTGSIDHGIGKVRSGVPVSTAPLASTTTFTLTVTDGADRDTAMVTVTVTPAPSGPPSSQPFCTLRRLHGGPAELAVLGLVFALFWPLQKLIAKRRGRAQ